MLLDFFLNLIKILKGNITEVLWHPAWHSWIGQIDQINYLLKCPLLVHD